MAREIPEIVRAAAGLTATVLDETRKLPETLPRLPLRAIGLAMQTSLKLQQHYSRLVARGDEVFTVLRGDDEPGLATFDDDEDDIGRPALGDLGSRTSAFDRAEHTTPGPLHPDPLLDEAITDTEVARLPADPAADSIVAAVEGMAGVAGAAEALEDVLADANGAGRPAPRPAPVDGYDGFSIAALRGHLRGYAPTTVRELLAYEQATRARAPYLTMLQNRLERVTAG